MGSGVDFRVYAPKQTRVAVVLESGRTADLSRGDDGWFSGFLEGVTEGTTYRFRIGDHLRPDPGSRFQPEGPHGPSQVVDPTAFRWTDAAWPGAKLPGQVVYEMHVGTFTPEGTFRAAMRELADLRSIGISMIELMPIAEFPGQFGWGYDGVDLYAPTRLYGRPDDLRAFVDHAHALGLAVILDVVYNHLGPSGNYLRDLSDGFFTDRYDNEWGDAIDFASEAGARAYFAENGAYWIEEFHFDGLRLDATQSIHDPSDVHVITEIGERARRAAGERSIVLFAENEPQEATLARPIAEGGMGLDALWNDDFHHSASVAATGRAEAYYSPTRGTPQELLAAVKWGFLFQGQYYPWQNNNRGSAALDLPPSAFTLFLENHDQVANSGDGARLLRKTSPGIYRALTALLLLAPGTPLLFQGQEYGSTRPFHYFADHEPELAVLVAKGRREFMTQFPSIAGCDLPEPHARTTFERCKLDPEERKRASPTRELVRDLLTLRRDDPTFRRQTRIDGAVLGDRAFLLRFGLGTAEERTVVVNLGGDLDFNDLAEPLVAPPRGKRWELLLSTEDPRYGGCGNSAYAPAQSAIVLAGVAR
jgi:maltooligosyltrehalose trehalohydrolase